MKFAINEQYKQQQNWPNFNWVNECKQMWRWIEGHVSLKKRNVFEKVYEEEIVEWLSRFALQLYCAFAWWLGSDFVVISGNNTAMKNSVS